MEKREIIILGAGGMLAEAWRVAADEWLRGRSESARFLSRAECDICDEASAARVIGQGVGVVINCAGFTDVDGAEEREAEAMRVNGEAPGLLAKRCAAVGALLVHYSTDYVFDGLASEPYRVEAPRSPMSAYGRSKSVGEERIEASGAEHMIIRTSWLYAARGKNFVTTIAKLCSERESLRVVSDQVGRPTCTTELARTTARLIDAKARGIWHACDAESCSWHEFARAIGERVNPRCKIEPCSTEEFPRPARRPAYSVLETSRTDEKVGAAPVWRESLARTLEQMETDAAHAVRPAGR